MFVPVLGKLYYCPTYDCYVVVKQFYITSRTRKIRVAAYKVDENGNRVTLFNDNGRNTEIEKLINTIESYFGSIELIPVDNKDERKRRPFFFADLREAMNLLNKKKYRRAVTIRLKSPVTFQRQVGWGNNKRQVDVTTDLLEYQYVEATDNPDIFKLNTYHNYYAAISEVNINDIATLEFGVYSFQNV